MTWHEGELDVQTRAGVRELSDRVGRIIGTTVPPAAAAFLRARPFVVVSTVDARGDVTASLLAGPAGFAAAPSETSVHLEPAGGHVERVLADVAATGEIGLLAIDPATRRRMRVNGRARIRGGAIDITTREVYSNCPQYIHVRETLPAFEGSLDATFIAAADTLFIASWHPVAGADASHRGGPAGFVRVEAPDRISFADYPGNNMFNTLGNISVQPRVGLLFADFASGRTLQIRGDAAIQWNGDERRVVVQIR